MASPFSVFRKKQKLMLAVLALLAILAFVFLPVISDLQYAGSGQTNAVVVKTSAYGELRESEVEALRHQRQKVLVVLGEVMQLSGGSASGVQQFLDVTFGPATEEAVVNTWLLARRAEQMGMVISDETINRFLQGVTQDKVKLASFQAAFKRAGFSDLQFFTAMRDELAAQRLRETFYVSLGGLTPAQRWEYYTRVKQMAKIEAVPVPVARYVDKVADPGDEDLQAFFEQNKEQYPRPDSPEPGFREPQKIAAAYFKADVEKFAAQVTDGEVQQHYEKNKDAYDQLEKKPEANKAGADEGKEATKSAKGTDAKESNETTKEAAKGVSEPGKAKEEPGKSPVEPGKAGAEQKSKETSSLARPSLFRLTAMQKEDKPAAASTPEAGKTDAKEPEPQKTPDATAEKKATEETKAPAEAAEKPAETPAASPEKPAEKAAAPKAGAAAKPALSDTLKNRIRRELAFDKIQGVFDKLRAAMENYRRQWSSYEVARIQAESRKGEEGVTLPKAPAKLDFEKLAKEHAVTAGSTDLVSQWEARQSEIGESLVNGRDPVWHYAFVGMGKLRPEMSIGLKGDLFLFWKTEETKERIPKFSDEGVRERVLHAWKTVHARPLALKQAESLAAEAAKTDKPLKEAFADRPDVQVVEPAAFGWMTFGNVPLGSAPGAARISEVDGIAMAGGDFMRTVFALTPGQTGAQFNGPKTDAYAIRLQEFTPAREVIWKQFEVDDFNKYSPVAQEDQRQVVRAWLESIKKAAGLQWQRNPDRTLESSVEE